MFPILSLLAAVSAAHAQDDDATFADILGQAKEALVAGDYKVARDLLVTAEQKAPTEDALLPTSALAKLFFYRGVLYWRASPESAALDAWKQTLTIDPAFQPEADLLGEQSERDTFLALGDEVKARGDVDLALPDDPGEAKIYVDGRAVEGGESVVLGTHFVQIKCEDGELAGAWYEYGTPPDNYLTICDGGVYKGPRTSSSSSSSKSKSSDKSKSKSEDKPKSSASKTPDFDEDEPSAKADKKGGKSGKGARVGAGIGVMAVGALGGGATALLYDQAAQAAAAYELKKEAAERNPDIRQAADDYYEEVVTPRFYRTYAVAGASAVLLAGGLVLVIIDAEGPGFTPVPGGGVLTWSGRF